MKNNKKLNSIEKAIEILLKFQESKPSWGIRELSAELDFSPATVQRILQVLKSYDFVRQHADTRQYFIGNIFYNFLHTLNNSNNLVAMGRQFLQKVASETRETVHLNIIEDNFRVCIDMIESPRVLKAGMPIGNKSPLYAGASAKCLLAFSTQDFIENYISQTTLDPVTEDTITEQNKLINELKKIRKRGYALSFGERTPGLGSLSTPVFDNKGLILASLSLAIPEIRIKKEDHLQFCINILTSASKSFSKLMGFETGKF